jgi:hypothetical protein
MGEPQLPTPVTYSIHPQVKANRDTLEDEAAVVDLVARAWHISRDRAQIKVQDFPYRGSDELQPMLGQTQRCKHGVSGIPRKCDRPQEAVIQIVQPGGESRLSFENGLSGQ